MVTVSTFALSANVIANPFIYTMSYKSFREVYIAVKPLILMLNCDTKDARMIMKSELSWEISRFKSQPAVSAIDYSYSRLLLQLTHTIYVLGGGGMLASRIRIVALKSQCCQHDPKDKEEEFQPIQDDQHLLLDSSVILLIR